MNRNMEIIRDILLKLESEKGHIKSEIEGYEADLVRYNMGLLVEAGLVEGTVDPGFSRSQAPDDVFLRKLTWLGHEFLDNIREKPVWNTIKDEFKDASLSTIISVSKKLAEGYAKKKVEELLSESP